MALITTRKLPLDKAKIVGGGEDLYEYLKILIREISLMYEETVPYTIGGTEDLGNFYGVLDGGYPDSTFGGIAPIDAGGVT